MNIHEVHRPARIPTEGVEAFVSSWKMALEYTKYSFRTLYITVVYLARISIFTFE